MDRSEPENDRYPPPKTEKISDDSWHQYQDPKSNVEPNDDARETKKMPAVASMPTSLTRP